MRNQYARSVFIPAEIIFQRYTKMSKGIEFKTLIGRVEKITFVRAIRNGLISMIPVLIIGAFALILKTFPIAAYQRWIESFAGGFFLEFLNIIYGATFGVLSLYMTFSISRAYMKLKADRDVVSGGAAIASVLSFFILAGAYLSGFGTESMGPKSMFLAILTGLGASALYYRFARFFLRKKRVLFSSGADREFNRMLSTFLPIAMVTLIFALFNALIIRVFDVDSFRMLLSNAFNAMFSWGENGFFKGFFFVLFSSVLWFFGIHGSDTLEGVMQTYFAPGLAENQAAVAAGALPTTILTKEFFDCFVLMGGCGSTICLLIAILLFSRNKARRGLGLTAAFPMIFNINEMMVFGLPIIFNPVMLIPFLTVPLVCYSTAYVALSTGIVPLITNSVEWTTPIILGGYYTTGSVAGALLQVFNVALGVLIYLPFVKLMDKQTAENSKTNYTEFMKYFRENESALSKVKLSEMNSVYGDFAKDLCAEIRHGIDKEIVLAYQPQYDYDGKCVGVEALLRWKHHEYGMLYPPLVIKLAEEAGFLPVLEEKVLTTALSQREEVLKKFGSDVELSVNVTGTTVATQRYINFCRQLNEKDPFLGKNICIEVTEQVALSFDESTRNALISLREMGLMLAIDDFSMGHTSLHYLKDNMFDMVKLDGSLIQGMFTHQNSREIISSILSLSATLSLTVVAEYVETEEQRDALHELGCNCYQGYLYSPAVFLDK